MSYFVLLSYPRTGSTVLQRMINTSSSHHCTGEKPMAINHLYAFMKSIEDTKTTIPESLFPHIPLNDDRNPVYGADLIDRTAILMSLREMFSYQVLCRSNFVNLGWKENFISPYRDGDETADGQIALIRELFPTCKFILNIRNPHICASSSIWRHNPAAVKEIGAIRGWLIDRHFRGNFGDSILLDHDEWGERPDVAIRQLSGFGIDIDERACLAVASEKLTHISNL